MQRPMVRLTQQNNSIYLKKQFHRLQYQDLSVTPRTLLVSSLHYFNTKRARSVVKPERFWIILALTMTW